MAEEKRVPGSWSALFRFELVKMAGRRITWVPFFAIGIIAALIVTVFYHAEFKFHREMFKSFKLDFKSKDEFANGYYMAVHSFNPLFQLLIPIFISVASGLMIAGEAEQGTLRACLIRPVSRSRLILSKFIVLWAYAMLISNFTVVLLTVLGILNFGTGTLYTMNVFFNNGLQGISAIPPDELPGRLVLAWLLASVGMTVLAALALLVSSLVETASMAYVITLAIYFAVFTLRAFPFLDWLHPYLFVTHMMRWQQCFYSEVKTGEIFVSLIHQAGYIVAFLSAAVLLFKERDIKS